MIVLRAPTAEVRFNYGVKRMVMYVECNLITFNELLSRLRVHRVVLIMLMSC